MNSRPSQIRQAVLTLALPVTVSSLLQRTEGILDIFLVGGLGATAIAAVGIGQLLVFFAVTVVASLTVGATVVIAQLWGARRFTDAGQAAVHVLALALVISLALMALGILVSRPAMKLLGAAPDVVTLAGPYLDIIFLVIPFTIVIQVLSGILHGTADTRTPMYAMIGVNVLHVLLAYPLIYGRWGFPNLGINGAAVAVGAAESVGVLVLLIRCSTLFVRPTRLRRDLARAVWDVGLPVFGERVVQQVGVLLYTKLVLMYGTIAYAAHQVGLSIEAFSFLPGYGFAVAAATMAGQSIGAGKYARAKLENWEANRLAAFVMAGMGLLFFFYPYALLRAFTDDPAVIELGTLFLKIVALLQIPLALTMVLSGSLRGAGDTRYIMGTTIVGMWGVRLPLACIAALWLHLDLIFVWSAMVADWTIRMGLLIVRYRSERWHGIQVLR
ncbi:MATE family efflux transporter [Nitrospiraceae bacterium AH_259_D15_M11_P09]|nr:MATE family efflux transporter [Nitrospiraceae bacterium AH_259_D15_M11_P09]